MNELKDNGPGNGRVAICLLNEFSATEQRKCHSTTADAFCRCSAVELPTGFRGAVQNSSGFWERLGWDD